MKLRQIKPSTFQVYLLELPIGRICHYNIKRINIQAICIYFRYENLKAGKTITTTTTNETENLLENSKEELEAPTWTQLALAHETLGLYLLLTLTRLKILPRFKL